MSKALRPSVGTTSATRQPETQEGSGADGRSPIETAQYVAEFSAELAYLPRQAKLDLLAYLLDMARLEAVRTVQSSDKEA